MLELRPEPQSTPITKWILGTLEPGVLEYWHQNEDATLLTFRIRRGLKWSDGTPVTSEDVRFCIEDVALEPDIYPVPEEWTHWGSEPVQVEVVDSATFRLRFAASYGLFIPRLAMWRYCHLMLPVHYLKRFHRDYTPIEQLLPLMQEDGYSDQRDWPRWYREVTGRNWGVEGFVPGRVRDIESYPTLEAWLHDGQPNPGDLVWVRNPYYYKIDVSGRQLPYIDRMVKRYVSDMQVMNLKIIAGETDFQYQLLLSDYPLLKKNESAGNYRALLLPDSQDYRLIFPLNLSPRDTFVKRLMTDVRFRRALSLALNREEIRDVLLMGFGRPSQLAPLPGTPWYDEALTRAYAEYDVEEGNRMLDEIGLPWDSDRRFRLRPDGERLVLRIDVPTSQTEWVKGAELAREYWSALGIDLLVKPTGQYGQLRESNQSQLTSWWANAAVPLDFSFVSGFRATPLWETWHQTGGARGEEPPAWAREIYAQRARMMSTPSVEDRTRAGMRIFRILAEQLYVIGTVAESPVPFVVSRDLKNVAMAAERPMHGTTTADAADQWFFTESRRRSL